MGIVEEAERVNAALALLDQQDGQLSEIQKRASELGVNVTLHVRELYGEGIPCAGIRKIASSELMAKDISLF